jgi:Cupredoxin-like domain
MTTRRILAFTFAAALTLALASVAVAQPAKASKQATQNIRLIIKSDDEHGKKGPDGKWHDAFLPGGFTVKAGAKVTVTVLNYDQGPHSFTSPGLHVNQIFLGGTAAKAHITTFTFVAPKKTGRYLWWCAQPCDPWAMAHVGYMRGYVRVA